MKNYGKMSPTFNSPYQNQVIWQFSRTSEKKEFGPFFKTFLTNQGKNENEDEKNWKNEFNF